MVCFNDFKKIVKGPFDEEIISCLSMKGEKVVDKSKKEKKKKSSGKTKKKEKQKKEDCQIQ